MSRERDPQRSPRSAPTPSGGPGRARVRAGWRPRRGQGLGWAAAPAVGLGLSLAALVSLGSLAGQALGTTAGGAGAVESAAPRAMQTVPSAAPAAGAQTGPGPAAGSAAQASAGPQGGAVPDGPVGDGAQAGPPLPASGPAGQAASPPSPRALRAAEYDARAKLLEDRFQAGVSAYRAGDYGEARRLWSDLLASAPKMPSPGHGQPLHFDVGRLLYNLGNACLRCGQPLEALGAYSAALRLAPRDAALRANLARARAAAGLAEPPAPRLVQQLSGWLDWPTPAERRWMALLGLLPLALALLYEALAGGRGARRALAACLLLAAAAAAPLAHELLGPSAPEVLVVSPGGAPLYSEPRLEARQVGQAAAGETLRELDALPGWRRVVGPGGPAAWTPAGGLFHLEPPFGKRLRP